MNSGAGVATDRSTGEADECWRTSPLLVAGLVFVASLTYLVWSGRHTEAPPDGLHADDHIRRLARHDIAAANREARLILDVPWLVLDTTLATSTWRWTPTRTTETILDEILVHAQQHADWLDVSAEA